MNPFDSSQLLTVIFETAVDGIVVIDDRGIMRMVNPAITRLFGYSSEELLGNSINMLMPTRYAAKHDGYIQGYMNTGKRHIIGVGREVEGLRKDGSIFPFDLSVSELKMTDGTVLFAGTVHDISAQKEAQAQIEALNSQLEVRIAERTEQLAKVVSTLLQTNTALRNEITERSLVEEALQKSQKETQKALEKERELSDLKSRFITTASHEFRTPLSSILSSAKLIARYTDDDGQENRLRHINRIQSSVNNLNDILSDLLSWSKLEENKVVYRPVDFDLTELTQEAVEEIQAFTKKGQSVFYEHKGERSLVTLDPVFIKNILLNLLSNAVKYSAEHQPIYIFSNVVDDHLQLHVKDQGIGIPVEEHQHLFERFFRAKNVDTIQGTGLGLNIVKKYVAIMNGKISFESEINKGCIFTVTIPLKKEKAFTNA